MVEQLFLQECWSLQEYWSLAGVLESCRRTGVLQECWSLAGVLESCSSTGVLQQCWSLAGVLECWSLAAVLESCRSAGVFILMLSPILIYSSFLNSSSIYFTVSGCDAIFKLGLLCFAFTVCSTVLELQILFRIIKSNHVIYVCICVCKNLKF